VVVRIAVGVAILLASAMLDGSLAVVADAPGPTGSPASSNCTSIHLTLSNPSPGDVLSPGAYVVNGLAVDSTAAALPGIDRVQAFVDNPRQAGGHLVGEVDATSTNASQFLSAGGFTLLVNIPDTPADHNTHFMYVYARSSGTGVEQSLMVTFQLNKPLSVDPFTPTPTPPPNVQALATCGSPTPTPTFPPFPLAAPGVPATPGAIRALTLRVGNPSGGDTVSAGMYTFQGVAFDPQAQGNTGVDRVQVFLDPRDEGGVYLGDAMLGSVPQAPFGFQLTAPLPNRKGGHLVSVYAHSSVTGQETAVSVPITLN
jgi:hypothetical protein